MYAIRKTGSQNLMLTRHTEGKNDRKAADNLPNELVGRTKIRIDSKKPKFTKGYKGQ